MTLNLELEVDKVFKKLLEERNKTVILAVEEGSCAWGLDSVDSDHDIRFIYLSDISYYLSIERHKQRDALVFEEKNMDFSGWDFRKALQLCRESNPGLLDWLRSSKILIKENLLIDELLKLAIETHCTKSLFYHWLNTAEKHDKLFFGDKNQVILKKYFYVLRPLLCIEWKRLFFINNNRDNELPPMILKELVESISVEDKNCTLNENVKIEILKLIERKTKSNMGTGDRIKVLDEWIEKSWNFYGEYCKKLEKRKQDKKYLDLFDQFFQKTIRKYLLK